MNCSKCGGKTRVRDTRDETERVRRVRQCADCGRRFVTFEQAEDAQLGQLARIRKQYATLRAEIDALGDCVEKPTSTVKH